MLLTAKMMLDWLKENDKAKRLESAIARVIKEGKVRTYDMGGKGSTIDVAKAIADYAAAAGQPAASPIADEDEARLERAPFLCQITTNGEL